MEILPHFWVNYYNENYSIIKENEKFYGDSKNNINKITRIMAY